MKIEFNNAVSAYNVTNKFKPVQKIPKIKAMQTGRTEDKIEISGEISKKAEVQRLSGSTAKNIETEHEKRLSEIKKAVSEGKYFIGTGDLADAIISRAL